MGNDHLERMKAQFAARFEQGAEGQVVFRRSLSAPGILCTPDERDRFEADFARHVRLSYWAMMVAAALVFTVWIAVFVFLSEQLAGWGLWIAIVLLIGGYVAANLWFWNVPWRALRSRSPMDVGRSKVEAVRLGLARVTWLHPGGSVVVFLAAAAHLASRENLLVGWNRLWLVLFGLVLLAVALTAIRKLASEGRLRIFN